jgi:hypothetical protein
MENQEKTVNDDVPLSQGREEVKLKKYAFASRRALSADYIGYCYRDTPENNIDSGWRFLYGDEDDDFLDNPTNSESVYPEEMLSINPALDVILGAPVGTEFEWDEESESYIELIN